MFQNRFCVVQSKDLKAFVFDFLKHP
jgi:hypothetical protein